MPGDLRPPFEGRPSPERDRWRLELRSLAEEASNDPLLAATLVALSNGGYVPRTARFYLTRLVRRPRL